MPSMIGKEKKKKELIANLSKIFEQLQVSSYSLQISHFFWEFFALRVYSPVSSKSNFLNYW